MENAEIAADRGGRPFLMPTTTHQTKIRDSPSIWKDMMNYGEEHPREYLKNGCYKRSNAESPTLLSKESS
jgi:hypothetical protein